MTNIATVDSRKAFAGKYAAKHVIDLALLCAVAHHESGGWNTWAMRYEPGFFARYIQPQINIGTVKTMTEGTARATSWGLMQVMGQTAREFGFGGKYLTQLCDPDVGLEYGCRKLARCLSDKSGDVRAALMEYNGGGNPQYPDLVSQWYHQYQ